MALKVVLEGRFLEPYWLAPGSHSFTPNKVARLKLPCGYQLLQPLSIDGTMLLTALCVVPLLCH